MNLKISLLVFFLGTLFLKAQSVDCRFTPIENICQTGQYCINIEVSSDDGADLLGHSSIRFSYDDTVVRFLGDSNDGVTMGSYKSLNFDNDQNSLCPSCEELGGTPYEKHSFDGKVSGDFMLTWILLQPTLFGTPSACPAINEGEWVKVNEICFEVLDPEGNPNFQFSGTENGLVTDEAGTNFNDHYIEGTKYQNGSFEDLDTPFSVMCGGVEPILTDISIDIEEPPKVEEIKNSSVDYRMIPIENTCETGQYCINIEVSSDEADFLGDSELFFYYNGDVVAFQGSYSNGVSIGSYTSFNFDDDQTSLCPSCAELGATPYSEHYFDGQGSKFTIGFTLLEPTLFGAPSACPAINEGEWVKVSEICFDVLDPEGDPGFVFGGTENTSEVNTSYFTSHDGNTLYENGSFDNLHTPFSELCQASLVAVTDDVLYNQIIEESSHIIMRGAGKTDLNNLELQLSPVPTKDILTVTYQSNVSEKMTLSIYDIKGNLIAQKEYTSQEGSNVLSIDLSQKSAGLYLLQLNNGIESITKNIVKK